MATFTPEEIEFIRARGNDYCRRVWLGLYEGESVNFTDEQSVKDFMSDKYEKKRYYLESASNPALMNGNSSLKNKSKTKSGSVAGNNAPLISISPQTSKAVNNNTMVNTAKVVNNLLPVNESSHKVARPVNNSFTQHNVQPLLSNISVVTAPAPPEPVPE